MSYSPENNWPDKQLVASVLNGDNRSFSRIIKNTEGLVAKIVFQMISNIEDRKDIAQDIYLKAFKNLSGFKFQSKLSTWIGQIAYNTCLNYLDKKKLVLVGNLHENSSDEEEMVLDRWNMSGEWRDDQLASDRTTSKQRSAILQSAMDALPPLYKTLVVLFHQQEMGYDEIAQVTALPAGTVKSYLFRARKALKEQLLSKYEKEEI